MFFISTTFVVTADGRLYNHAVHQEAAWTTCFFYTGYWLAEALCIDLPQTECARSVCLYEAEGGVAHKKQFDCVLIWINFE